MEHELSVSREGVCDPAGVLGSCVGEDAVRDGEEGDYQVFGTGEFEEEKKRGERERETDAPFPFRFGLAFEQKKVIHRVGV